MIDLHASLAMMIQDRRSLGWSPGRMVRAWLKSRLVCLCAASISIEGDEEDMVLAAPTDVLVIAALRREGRDWKDRRPSSESV